MLPLQSFSGSSIPSIGVLVVIGVATWFVKNLCGALASPLRKLPGPILSLYTNLPLKFATVSGRRTLYIHALHKRYGSVVRVSPHEVSIVDPEACRTIHRPASEFNKSEWYSRFVNHEVPGIFEMSDPRQHAARRKLFARPFSKSELRAKWETMIQEKVELAMQKIESDISTGQAFDVYKWWIFLATDVVGHLMFGESFRTLEHGKKGHYIQTLQYAAKGGGIAVELPLFRIIGRHIPLPTFRALFLSNDYLMSYGKRAVEISRDQESDSRNVFAQIDAFSKSESNKQPLTDLEISTEAGNLILAGSDTTAFSLTYITWAVLSHPHVQSALEAELAVLDHKDFTDAKLEELPLLNAVIKETLRIWGPSSGSLPRTVPKGGAQLAGYFIPGGCDVSTQTWTLHRNASFWPEPEKFDPYRWIDADVAEAARMAYSPFGSGSRTCLGVHLAMMELRITISQFFRRFRGVKLAPGQKMELENFFLIKPAMEQLLVLPPGR